MNQKPSGAFVAASWITLGMMFGAITVQRNTRVNQVVNGAGEMQG